MISAIAQNHAHQMPPMPNGDKMRFVVSSQNFKSNVSIAPLFTRSVGGVDSRQQQPQQRQGKPHVRSADANLQIPNAINSNNNSNRQASGRRNKQHTNTTTMPTTMTSDNNNDIVLASGSLQQMPPMPDALLSRSLGSPAAPLPSVVISSSSSSTSTST